MATPVPDWLDPVFGGPEPRRTASSATHRHRALLVLTVLGAGLGLPAVPQRHRLQAAAGRPVVTAARRNLYGDAFNEAVFEKPGHVPDPGAGLLRQQGHRRAGQRPGRRGRGRLGRLRRLQTGFVRSYALSMLGGALLVVAAFLVVRLG